MERDVWVVGGALAVTLRVSRVLGAAPLRWQTRGATLHARVSRTYALYGIVLVTFLNIIVAAAFVLDFVKNFGNSERMVRGYDNADTIMWLLDVIVTQSFATFAAYTGHSRMTSLIYHFNQLKKATLSMHTNWEKKQNREKKRIAIAILIYTTQFIMVTYDVIYTAISSLSEEKEVLVACLYAAYNVCYLIGVAVGMQLLFLIYEIHAAMESLNEELEWIIFNIHETRPLNKAEEDSLRRVAVLYDTVSDVVRHFNTDDGGLMFWKFAIFNIYLLFTFYNFYDSMIISVAAGDSITCHFVIIAMWCSVHIMGMIIFVEPCHQTMQQVNKFRGLLTDLMYRTQRPGAPSSLCVDVLYKQLVLDTFNFSPLGVCTLTRPLFTASISGFTTCFVIVLQYRLSSMPKEAK